MDLKPDYSEYQKKNPWYPLPKDYDDLTTDGQRQARLSLVVDQKTPLRFVRAWDCFRRFYLQTTEPGFFYHDWDPSPEFHYELIHDAGRYSRNVFAAPRGYAKSVVVGTELPMFLSLTRPYSKIALGLSTERLTANRMSTMMKQFTENEFIYEDFGQIKPKRSAAGIWNTHQLDLLNGTTIEGFSVMGRKRGARPQLFILDDPEFDPESKNTESSTRLLEKFENVMFRQILPMLEKGSSIVWIGTIIQAKCFLAHAIYGDNDPRFKAWNRRLYTAGLTEKQPLWGAREDLEFLEYRKKEMGAAAFSAEFENKPATEEERLLEIKPELNEYTLDEQTKDDKYDEQPLLSTAMVNYHERKSGGELEKKRESCKETFGPMFRFITFDYAEGLTQYHDYSCVAVLGMDKLNCLWVLDMWMGRAKRVQLLNIMYNMGVKWKVRVIGLEAVGLQGEVVEAMQQFLDDIKAADVDPNWHPGVVPIKYPSKMSKSSRISGLQWRFGSGRIKYPAHLKDKWPINKLYEQTLNFTPDLALLRHDDAIDTVAMHQFVIRAKGSAPRIEEDPGLVDMVRGGKTDVNGVPISSGLRTQDVTPEVLEAILDKNRRGDYNDMYVNKGKSKPRYKVRRPHVVRGKRII